MDTDDPTTGMVTPAPPHLLQRLPQQPQGSQCSAGMLGEAADAFVSPVSKAKLMPMVVLTPSGSPGPGAMFADNSSCSPSPGRSMPSAGFDVPPHSPQLTFSQYTSQTGLGLTAESALLAPSHTSSVTSSVVDRSALANHSPHVPFTQ